MMHAPAHEKIKRDLKISAAKKLEPEVINDDMIREYIRIYNIENKIYDQDNMPITMIMQLSLSFKSIWCNLHTNRHHGDPQP